MQDVSIHAPAWGATCWRWLLGAFHVVSIHAPAWGATRSCAKRSVSDAVSIHAPAWGATARKILEASSDVFQSTLPRGERPVSAEEDVPVIRFNPRSRVGSDFVIS